MVLDRGTYATVGHLLIYAAVPLVIYHPPHRVRMVAREPAVVVAYVQYRRVRELGWWPVQGETA